MRAASWIALSLGMVVAGAVAGCPEDEEMFVQPGGGEDCTCWGLTLTPTDQAELDDVGEALSGLGFDCTRAGSLDEEQWYECNWLSYEVGADCSSDAEIAVTSLEGDGLEVTAACPCVCDG